MPLPMPLLEAACAIIVALYVVAKLRAESAPGTFALRMAALVVAAWVGENTVIEAYGFYTYSPAWSVFVHHVPLMIVLIWPVVIHSAWDLARAILGPGHRGVPLLSGLLVLADASLIEPIAVRAGLWWWNEPGLFGVPLIGIAGWALFAVAAVWALQRAKAARHLPLLGLAPLFTHAALLVGWWALFRWTRGELSPWPFVAAVWTASVLVSIHSLRRGLRRTVPLRDVMLRAPGAAFFFVLLAASAPPLALTAYALAFAPPYLTLLARDRSSEPGALPA